MTREHLDYETIRADTVRQVAKLMSAAAITAPKSGGQLFLAGKANFMETVIVDDQPTRAELAAWMRCRGKERREQIWFRDAVVSFIPEYSSVLASTQPTGRLASPWGSANCALRADRRAAPREAPSAARIALRVLSRIR